LENNVTKNELANLKIVVDSCRNGEDFYDISNKDIIDFIATPANTKTKKFLQAQDACFVGALPWSKFKTCEAALKSAWNDQDYDALYWFLDATVNKGVDRYGSYQEYQRVDGPDGNIRPLKFFLDAIPKAYRTAQPKKAVKKGAKKAVKKSNAKRKR
jgi:hypothetical protein